MTKKREIPMKKVAFHNLGCKVNSYEMDVMQQKLVEKDMKLCLLTQKLTFIS